MSEFTSYPSADASPLHQVLLCDVYHRHEVGERSTSTSLPGHLIQLTRTGSTTHEVGGRRYELSAGHLIWFHEDEWVKIHVQKAPWSFYTLNFIAPSLSPPPFEQRVRQVGAPVQRRFESLLKRWRDTTVPAGVRHMRVQAGVLNLLADLGPPEGRDVSGLDPRTALWWQIETRMRRNIDQPIDLEEMVQWSHKSRATIARSCQAAVGVAPMKRVKQIRLSLARGLVQRSDWSITQIAQSIGYTRVHEFSRDYRKHFGLAPTSDR